MERPGNTSLVFVKIFDPHHLSSPSLVGGRLPIKGFPVYCEQNSHIFIQKSYPLGVCILGIQQAYL
jgi:hypothetical protein